MKQFSNLLLFILYGLTLILSFIVYSKQQNTNIDLKNKVDYLELQLQETENRCSRMTDTCIDIIANRRWEE